MRARPLTERPNVDRTAVACAEGEHEDCTGLHHGTQVRCSCGCHVDPWPFEAADYTPPERD